MKILSALKQSAILILCCFLQYGCGSDYSALADYDAVKQLYANYLQEEGSTPSPVPTLHTYLDYSSGMYEAVRQNKSVVDELLNMIDGPDTRYYRVGFEAPLLIQNIKAPTNSPYTPSNYNDNRSRLREAVQALVKKDGQALFISDFELIESGRKDYEARLQDGQLLNVMVNPTEAWAKTPFLSWFKKGGAIDIFTLPFTGKNYMTKGPQQQQLYVVFFTPKSALISGAYYAKDFAQRLSSNAKVQHFHFETLARLQVERGSEYSLEHGGLHDYLAGYQYHFERFSDQAAFYDLPYAQVEQTLTSSDLKDKRLLRHIFLPEQENLPAGFADLELTLRSYDLSDMYESYLAYQSTKSEKPTYEVDPETGDSNLVAGNPGADFSFEKGQPLEAVFRLTRNKATRELGIGFAPEYTLTKDYQLLLAETYLQDYSFQLPEAAKNQLIWRDARGFEITSLRESLEEALRDAQKAVGEQVLYRHFVNFNL